MASNKQTIVSDIKSYVANNGGDYSQWYIGIAASPRQRMFNDHAVRETGDAWIYGECVSSAVAREIEDYFICLGIKGGPGGGDSASRFIYAYRITSSTKE